MTRARAAAAMALTAGVLSARVVSADVTLVETLSITAGGKALQGTRTTSISGARMRVDTVPSTRTTATIFDLPSGAIINLDAKAKRAEARDISARAADVEKEYPRARVTASLAPAGASREIAGVSSARNHDLVLGEASNNKILLARTRAQTELYRLIAEAGGIPYGIDMTFSVDGRGVLSSMVRKVVAGTQLLAVTTVDTAPIPPAT